MNENESYPKEMYKDDIYRVVWGPEEHTSLERAGWSPHPSADIKYRPITAVAAAVKTAPKATEDTSAKDTAKDTAHVSQTGNKIKS